MTHIDELYQPDHPNKKQQKIYANDDCKLYGCTFKLRLLSDSTKVA